MANRIRFWVHEPPPADVQRSLERLFRAKDVQQIAVMPDVHLSGDVCVGVAVGTTSTIYPAAVGGDIGCGMAAAATGLDGSQLSTEQARAVLAGFGQRVPILRHSTDQAVPSYLDTPLSSADVDKVRRREVAKQLGTLGRGNHFLEVQEDEDGELWLTVHTGSRGIGQAIRDHHEGARGLSGIEAQSPEGAAYLSDHDWALRFAAENRARILDAAFEVLEEVVGPTKRGGLIECHHNFVERRDDLYVHRKGALDASSGAKGIIPGSMGSTTYHVEGRGLPEALWSSSHGAGRCLSRTEARRRVTTAELQRQLNGVVFDEARAKRLVDEAPSAYKNIGKVMRAQRRLTKIVRRLETRLTFKGA